MMKIFTTQVTGHFNRILDQEELQIEDSARLLAQAVVGAGSIYIYGHRELHGVVVEATIGSERLDSAKPLFKENGDLVPLTSADRILLFSYTSIDEETITLAKKLQEKGIQTIGVSALMKNEENGLDSITDLHIDSKLRQPLIPDDDGSRYGYPALMVALYVYYALRFTVKEILSEND
ncbi:DUF2529 domain-containing protein [Metabacillus herbersteinensis]|uniref:DUF2529 domain-containing protein n=1 Tax=Metabacillus herbersteinensis TaxID=283816 RepID=A0ABV6GG57_9BACI